MLNQVHNLNDFGRGPQKDSTNQMSKLKALCFLTKNVLFVSLYCPCI